MRKCILLFLLCTVLISCIPAFTQPARAANYGAGDWEALIQNYKESFCGKDTVDWNDPEIQKIVGVKNSSGLSTSGISYNGGRYWMDLENNRNHPNRVFGSQDISISIPSDTMRKQLVYLCYMANAYGTPGTSYSYKDQNGVIQTIDLYQNEELRSAIFYGLEKSMTFFNYEAWDKQHTGPASTTNYNWWDWTYGGQKEILQTLIIMYPFRNAEEQAINDSLNAICLKLLDAIRPNNTGKTDNTSIGYRRVRLGVTPMIAALTKDEKLMEETLSNLVDFLEDDPAKRDGVKSDYSYICHFYYPMEGTYGTDVLGNRIIGAYSVLSGTAFEPTSDLRINQFYWIMETFRPVIHNGILLAMNSGRFPNSGQSYAVEALKAALRLIGCFGEAEDLQLKQFIRSMVIQDTDADTQKAYSSYAVSLGEVNMVQTLKDIVIDNTIPAANDEYAHMRYATDRAVQHRSNYTVGIAMSSIRIGPYECVNGCNRYGWHTGDGMVYVYNDTTQYNYDQYGGTFQRFANMYHVPGTTEEDATLRQPWSERAPYFTGMTYTHNEAAGKDDWKQDYDEDGTKACSFVGGVELKGEYITAAMEFEAYSWTEEESRQELIKIHNSAQPDEYAERNKMKQVLVSDLSAKKSYFLFDDEIVCVGSDIDFSTRDNGVNTYVDNRQLRETSVSKGQTVYGTDDIIVDGKMLEKTNGFSAPKAYEDPSWVYGENFGGYYFPNGGQVYVNKTFRQSSNDGDDTNDDYNQINLAHSPTNETTSFFELWISHGKTPQNGTYSYVMLPEKTVEEIQAYTKNPDVKVLMCTEDIHVVREETLGITAIVFWKAGSYGGITVDQPMILMVQEQNGTYEFSVSDPTQELKSATITVSKILSLRNGDAELTVSGSGKTIIEADFSKNPGKSLSATFSVGEVKTLLFDFAESRSYESSAYGYQNYSNGKNWVTNGTISAVSGGSMTLTLNQSGTTELSAENLSLSAAGEVAAQIRLKIKGATASQPKVTLSYKADVWSEEILLCTPSQVCLQGEYATYGVSFTLPEKTITGIKIKLTGLSGGTAVIDHISVGKESESLYFGFDSDKTSGKYLTGTYGGYDYLNDAWATNLSTKAGKYYSVEAGGLSIYATDEYNGTAGTDQGIYVETTASPGVYPWSNRDRLALSYAPEKAEIIEIRFKTEALMATTGKTPTLALLYTREKDGEISRKDHLSVPFSVQNGVYQTIRIPVDEDFKTADFIKSLGFRFRYTCSAGENSVAQIHIDYIFVGSREDAPSSIYFDFESSERYDRSEYGAMDYAKGNWTYSNTRLEAPVYSDGTVSLKLQENPAAGSLYLQVGPYLTQKLPLHLDMSEKEVIQLRFKLENFLVGSDAKVGLYYYTTLNSHIDKKDQIRKLTDKAITAEEVNGEYITLTIPVTAQMQALDLIRSLRLNFSGLSKGETEGTITVDYIYIGSYDLLPMTEYLYFDFDGGEDDCLRYEQEAYGYTNFDDPEQWWGNPTYTTDPAISKGVLTFASTNAEGRTNHYVHSGWTHNVLPLNYVPGENDICRIRFSIENAVCSDSKGMGVFQLYYGIGTNATAGYDQVEFDVAKHAGNGYVTVTFPMDSDAYFNAEKITSLRFQFGRITSAEGESATFHIDYLYLGPEENAPAGETSLFVDFTNMPTDQERYSDKTYGERNLDNPSQWWTNSNNDEKTAVEDGKLIITATQGSASNIHYALSCQTFGSYPLQYKPKGGDLCQIRFKLENGISTDSSDMIRLSMIYGAKDNNSAGFDYVEFSATEYMDQGWATVTFPMDSANYQKCLEIVSIRPQISYVVSAEGEQFRFLIDYIYIGGEAGLPNHDKYYLATFDGNEEDLERYEDKLYGGMVPDVPESWWTNSTYATTPVVEKGAISLLSKLDTRTDHYFHSGPAHNVYPLAYVPGESDYCQVRIKVSNAVSTKASGIARFSLYFGVGDTSVVASGHKDFDLATYENGEYFVLTFPMDHSKYKTAHEISCLRPQLSYVQNAEGENLSLTIDYLYLGPKETLPLPMYTVEFRGADGTLLETQQVYAGEPATYTGTTPVKVSDEQNHYVFNGWDKSLSQITEDIVFVAQFSAMPHRYTYRLQDDEKHVGTCSCGYCVESAHSYTDGRCICGAVDIIEPIEDSSLKPGHTLNLASDISVNFVVAKSALTGFAMDTVYAECTVEVYTANERTGIKMIRLDPVEKGSYYYFTLTGLTAVHMNDRISTVIYGEKNGQVYVSPMDDYSIADYAYSQLNKTNMPNSLKTLCADLLRYGAKAQIFKAYRTDKLADAEMTDGQKAFLSDIDAVTFGNTNTVLNDLENAPVTWAGKALNLDSKVELKFIFIPKDNGYDPLKLTLSVSYYDVEGNTKEITLSNAEMYNQSRGYYAFTLDSLLAAELRSVVSVRIFAGETPVSCTLQYSADTYGNNKTGALLDLCKALFAYSDSAKAYFTA